MLKLAGAAYLVYLGVQTWRHRGDLAAALGRPVGPRPAQAVWQGVVVGVTNPKVLVLFAAVLPQFIDLGAGGPATQMLVLGLLFALIAATLDSTWGLAAGAGARWFATSPAPAPGRRRRRAHDDRAGRHPRSHRTSRLNAGHGTSALRRTEAAAGHLRPTPASRARSRRGARSQVTTTWSPSQAGQHPVQRRDARRQLRPR